MSFGNYKKLEKYEIVYLLNEIRHLLSKNFFPIFSGWSPPYGHPVHVASVPPRRSRMERPLGGSEQRCTITAGWEEEKYIYTLK